MMNNRSALDAEKFKTWITSAEGCTAWVTFWFEPAADPVLFFLRLALPRSLAEAGRRPLNLKPQALNPTPTLRREKGRAKLKKKTLPPLAAPGLRGECAPQGSTEEMASALTKPLPPRTEFLGLA